MHIREFSFRLLLVATLMGLFSCSSGGGGGGSDDSTDGGTDTITVVAPIFTSIIAGDGQVELTWIHVDEPVADVEDGAAVLTYNLYYANATQAGTTIDDLLNTFTQVSDISAVEGFQVVEGIDSLSFIVDGLENLSLYYFILTAVDVQIDADTGEATLVEGDASASEAFAMPRSSPFPDQPLADTGVTLCADYSYGIEAQDLDDNGLSSDELDIDGDGELFEDDNRVDCAGSDDDGDPLAPLAQQDANQGLDATTNDDVDGTSGFSYTLLDENGIAITDGSDPSCIQDNATGLIWEAKTADPDDLHYSKDRFSWYNNDTTLNGEQPGYDIPSNAAANNGAGDDICFGYVDGDEASFCNTSAFVDRVNAEALCGYTDWRLPDLTELRSLFNYGIESEDAANLVAAVDDRFIQNTEVDGGIAGTTLDGGIRYWSSQTYAVVPTAGWSFFFGFGGAPPVDKGTPNTVRLVRNDP